MRNMQKIDARRTPNAKTAGKAKLYAAFLALLFLGLATLSLCTGSGNVGLSDIAAYFTSSNSDETAKLIIEHIRLPRLCAGIIAGVSLALAGAGLQSLFRNPLADPSITGVSSGASLGAVVAISFFSSVWALQIGALAFGVLAAVAVCVIGRIDGKISIVSTLLAGIAVNAFCGAIIGYCMYTVRDAGLKGFIFWTLGSIDRADWSGIALSAAICIPAWLVMLLSYKSLNIVSLGRQQAFHAGANVGMIWIVTGFASVAMTAASVAICGIIGFVGLVVPHIIRLLVGPDNKRLLPLSAFGGACLVIFSDIVSRTVSPTDPVPIGVITALIGAPFFVVLLRRKGGEND